MRTCISSLSIPDEMLDCCTAAGIVVAAASLLRHATLKACTSRAAARSHRDGTLGVAWRGRRRNGSRHGGESDSPPGGQVAASAAGRTVPLQPACIRA